MALEASDVEKQPLLPKDPEDETSNTYDSTKNYGAKAATQFREVGSVLQHHARRMMGPGTVKDAMTYRTEDLSNWSSVMTSLTYTVWNRRTLWWTAVKLWILSIVVGFLVILTVKDPAGLKVSKFNAISDFLRVFVGLLLGFFMSASVTRWWDCVEAFQGLCGSVRKLQMMMIATAVPDDVMKRCLRYGTMSAWILHEELHIQALPLHDQEAATLHSWTALRSGEDMDEVFSFLEPGEADALQDMADPAGCLWVWAGSLLGKTMEEGGIKTGAAPAFSVSMGQAGEGLDKILRVRSSISVQAPYIYVQMLASLVHINNLVNALSFGMTTGVAVGTYLQSLRVNMFASKTATHEEAALDMQSLIVSFFFSCFGPFVYQALLEVSIAIAQPFSNRDAIVPTKRILHVLERDLHDAFDTALELRFPPKDTTAEPTPAPEPAPAPTPRGTKGKGTVEPVIANP